MYTCSNSTNSLPIESTLELLAVIKPVPVFILLLLIRSDKLVYFGCL